MKRTICLLTALLLLCCALPVTAAYAEGEMVDACPYCGNTDIVWYPMLDEEGRDIHHQSCMICYSIVGGSEFCVAIPGSDTCMDPEICAVCGSAMIGTQQPDPDKHTWSDAYYSWDDNGSGYSVTAKRHCRNGCGKTETSTVIAALVENKEATCTEKGYAKYAATFDVDWAEEQVYEYETDKLPHAEVVDEAVPASCVTSGLTEGSHCDVCGEVFVAQEEIPAWGHYDGDEDKVCDYCTADLTNPQTGDESVLGIAAVLMLVSACCLTVLPVVKKRFVR